MSRWMNFDGNNIHDRRNEYKSENQIISDDVNIKKVLHIRESMGAFHKAGEDK